MAPVHSPGRAIRGEVEAGLVGLSKKQRLVAEYFLANPTALLFVTATEVAERIGVDPATVVRFTQSFGFAGYPEFQEALRAEFPPLSSALDRLEEDLRQPDAHHGSGLIDRVRARTLENLERTFEQLDEGRIDAAVEQLLAARRVVVAGAGQSYALAVHLHRTLQTAQIASQLMADWYDLLFAAANIGPTDTIFGMTVWKYSRITVEALRYAKSVGASTILLTDAPFAPGAEVADITLLFAPQAIGEYLSPAAGAALIDCLAAALAARAPERVRAAMAIQYELAAAQGVTYR